HLEPYHIENMRRNIEWEWKRLKAKVEMGEKLPLPPTLVHAPVDEGEHTPPAK
ncbi:MAG: hypothetical protein GXP48_02060, partial [Acidobacteria bacterium]|nr:hypothetical protein [Acidobacteriota bacterium]